MPTIDHCIGCPYREFGPAIGTRGDRTSRMVLVGEAPGAKEVDQETPFFGSAGDVLWTALAEAGLREADVFVVNSVACRPFNSVAPIRRPSPDAIDACNGRLLRDIAAYPRAVIVALGATAVQAVTGQRGFLVTKKKPGTDLPSDHGTVVPTLHPAFVRRRGLEGPEYQMLVADLRHARRLASGTGSERVEMKVHNIPKFRLRCPLSEVMYWAARYAYADDSEVEAIGERARKRGWYTRDEFLAVARWKSPRSRRRCEENDEATVKAATQLALSTAGERQRIEALTQLHGIDYPTASVLLHLAHRDPYPIIDFRALWSLGVESPPAAYSFTFWWAYTQACRLLAKDAGVRMRTLDRALWQYSKERRPPTRTSAAEPGDAPKTPAPGETGVSKSEVMRRMYAEGSTVVEVAKALNVDYSFAYGVRKRWLEAQTEPSGQRSSGDGVPGRVGGAVGKRVLGIDGAEGGWFAALLVEVLRGSRFSADCLRSHQAVRGCQRDCHRHPHRVAGRAVPSSRRCGAGLRWPRAGRQRVPNPTRRGAGRPNVCGSERDLSSSRRHGHLTTDVGASGPHLRSG